jgi:hypothetical protein
MRKDALTASNEKELKMRNLRYRIVMTVAVAVMLVAGATPGVSLAAAHPEAAEQIIFSGQVPPGSFSVPAGFWVWCEDDEATNPYAGDCNGAMYFYELGLVRHVTGEVEELESGAYEMTLTSDDGAIACTLSNVPPVRQGPANSVVVACTAPWISGTFSGAVVRVTGPEE